MEIVQPARIVQLENKRDKETDAAREGFFP